MLQLPVTTHSVVDWIRTAAGVVNALLRRVEVLETVKEGDVRYEGGILEYWNGTAWTPV